MTNKKFAIFDNIKEARVRARITQKELARKLNLSDKTVSAYETGRAIPPSPALFQIAQITQTSITKLLGTTENKPEVTNDRHKLDTIIEKLTSIDNQLKELNNSHKLK